MYTKGHLCLSYIACLLSVISKHVFLLFLTIVMGDLLPFGIDVEDSILRINSDEVSNSPINLTSPIVFYMEQRTSLYVRNSLSLAQRTCGWMCEASPAQ